MTRSVDRGSAPPPASLVRPSAKARTAASPKKAAKPLDAIALKNQSEPSVALPADPAAKTAGVRGAAAVRAGKKAAQSSGAPRAQLIGPHTLRLATKTGERVELPAESYYLHTDGTARAGLEALVDLTLTRAPEEQQKLNSALSKAHARNEMSFRVKDPETGAYDKIFEVPCHGIVAPLDQAHFDLMVKSTEPVLQGLRAMLQVVYSHPNPTAKELGIDHLPEEEQKRVVDTIKQTVYFEPKLRAPQMKDYPFLSVAGFDAAVGKLDHPDPVFFEYNLGTPSGLSNNIQLLDILRETDPAQFEAIARRIPKDDTFAILKSTIDSNAQAWTGRADGISIVLSPGVHNGAHPDVASIAMFSGMPLVNPTDLFQDKEGNLRLNDAAKTYPLVTGIYGRMEESYFLQNSQDGIPIRSPDVDNAALSKQLGVDLEPGFVYRLKYDDKDEVVGIYTDKDGKPELQKVHGGEMGADPTRPGAAPGSFAQAILDKKLYYSGLGGRVVDDKRVFQSVSQYVAPALAKPGEPIAHPPRTLKLSEYGELYAAKDLSGYVIKEPDKSGGSGVALLANLPPAERQAAVEAVKKNPGLYIVQQFAPTTVVLSPEKAADGTLGYGSLANDWRLFSMMDAEGKVRAGPQSLLLRVAKPLSASTNTSQGAGYGIGLVLASKEGPAQKSVLPAIPTQQHLGASRRFDLLQFLDKLHEATVATEPGSAKPLAANGTAKVLAHHQRLVMDLLGRDLASLMSAARDFDDGAIDRDAFHAVLLETRAKMLDKSEYPAKGVLDDVHIQLARFRPKAEAAKKTEPTRTLAEREALLAKTSQAALPSPIVVREHVRDGVTLQKVELARYEKTPAAFANSVIAELAAAGGEVRRIADRDAATGKPAERAAGAYFRVDDAGRPIIGIDLAQNHALSGLAHEREHFLLWKDARDELVARGVPADVAGKRAMDRVNETDLRVLTERRAVKAEMAMDRKDRSEWNRGAAPALSIEDEGYTARIVYPPIEGLRDLLHRARWSGETLDEKKALGFLAEALGTATENRTARAAKDRVNIEALRKKSDPSAVRQVAVAHARAAEPLFDLVLPRGMRDQFETDGTSKELALLFEKALEAQDPLDLAGEKAPISQWLPAPPAPAGTGEQQ